MQAKHERQTRLKDMGTTGLIAYATTGSRLRRGLRTGQAAKVIAERYRSPIAVRLFRKACDDATDRADEIQRITQS